MTVDFLIIGQGISGTVLAKTIENNSLSYFILDKNNKITSSKVAAGIMQPISFKRCILSWRAEQFFEFSKLFYKKIDTLYKSNHFSPIKLVRIFSSFEEQNNWMGRSSSKIYEKHLGTEDHNYKNIINQYGSSEVKTAHRLKVGEFLKSSKIYFSEKKSLNEESVDVNQIYKHNNMFIYKNISAKYIVMCQGVNSNENDVFNYLPIIPNKGELIEIQSNYLPKVMLSKGTFTLPFGKNKYTVGSTYNHRDLSENITLSAKNHLLSNFKKITPLNTFQIIDHKYGFRPTTKDRKPIIGEHPEIKNLYIFNGMGSKAVLMAPLLAKELIDNIIKNHPLHSEVSVKRFVKNY
mgnify:CR=1 FL=1